MESALDINQAASVFAEMLTDPGEAEPEKKEQEAPVEGEQPEPDAVDPDEQESEVSDEEQPELITIKVDGKEVQVTLDELKNGYQRQADYTKKTMEVSDQRKQAETEIAKVREEREAYANKLQEADVLLRSQLGEQQNINWQQLLESDPVEYLKQQHLFQERQAALQRTHQEYQQLSQLTQAEQSKARDAFIAEQQEHLLAKLPEWKDEAKAKEGKAALREYLASQEFNNDELASLADHRQVILARKAMLYDQMMSKAQAAAKKVENLPQKVLRTGNGNSQNTDKRSSAFQGLKKTGSIDAAANFFASIL
jgi:hypothetical protein